ncbi:MAG: hypothetical protein HFP77_00745 [Methylococcales symbiont of Iophon sp. n. MRB-2018]|nr:MAG: hypothetical protein HFP77_00745 [Methylococcales symbiont of Iophon sp. n. MRB-2018]KAF3980694.1 MAG: hypothetical protein HFP76_00745 [Methylococcales symbiont of Iophon sp. n. MRB-2018]
MKKTVKNLFFILLFLFYGQVYAEVKISYEELQKIATLAAKSAPVQINRMTMLDSVVATPDLYMVYKYTVIENGFFQVLSEASGINTQSLPIAIKETFGSVYNAMKEMLKGESIKNRNKACTNKNSIVYRLLAGGGYFKSSVL